MPCMGPVLDDKKVAEAIADVEKLFKEKYGIEMGKPIMSLYSGSHEQVRKLLHNAIREVIWQEAVESF